MAALKNGKIPQQNISAILKRDGLIANSGRFRARRVMPGPAAQSFAVDPSWTGDPDVVQVFAPN